MRARRSAGERARQLRAKSKPAGALPLSSDSQAVRSLARPLAIHFEAGAHCSWLIDKRVWIYLWAARGAALLGLPIGRLAATHRPIVSALATAWIPI